MARKTHLCVLDSRPSKTVIRVRIPTGAHFSFRGWFCPLEMITSDYLESVVNFDEPILLVGPGESQKFRSNNEGGARLCFPMDVALIWFAEKLHGRKGRLDVFDLPKRYSSGGLHDILACERYIRKLEKFAPLGNVKFLKPGDIAHADLKKKEYGFIWDHDTLYNWVQTDPVTGRIPTYDNSRVNTTLNNYFQSLTKGGKLAIATRFGIRERFSASHLEGEEKSISLFRDFYSTNLTADQLFLREYGPFTSKLFSQGTLRPEYPCNHIDQISKS